jgi:predicted dehydrogenase
MAPSLAECDAMLDAAVRGHARLSVVAQNRFRTDVRRLHHLLASGAAGEILHAQVDSHWWRGHSYYDLWWRGTWAKEGGGCTLNHAVHHIDMLLWMMGLPDEVTAAMTNVAHDNAEVEDLSVALLRYKTGAIAQITSSVIHHGEEQQLIFQCRDARVSFPWRVCATTSRENGFGDPAPEREQALTRAFQELPPLDREGHAAQITDVLDAIEQGHPLTVDGAQGRNPVELVTAIYKSATTGVPVKLPLDPGDPWCVPGGIARLAPRFFEKKRSVEQFRDNRIVVGSSRDETDAHAKG